MAEAVRRSTVKKFTQSHITYGKTAKQREFQRNNLFAQFPIQVLAKVCSRKHIEVGERVMIIPGETSEMDVVSGNQCLGVVAETVVLANCTKMNQNENSIWPASITELNEDGFLVTLEL